MKTGIDCQLPRRKRKPDLPTAELRCETDPIAAVSCVAGGQDPPRAFRRSPELCRVRSLEHLFSKGGQSEELRMKIRQAGQPTLSPCLLPMAPCVQPSSLPTPKSTAAKRSQGIRCLPGQKLHPTTGTQHRLCQCPRVVKK